MQPVEPITMNSTTLFDHVGGQPFFNTLVDRFYDGVETEAPLRALYPPGPGARQAGIGAVPRASTSAALRPTATRRGTLGLRMRHVNFAIGPEERDGWVRHMTAAVHQADLDEANADPDARLFRHGRPTHDQRLSSRVQQPWTTNDDQRRQGTAQAQGQGDWAPTASRPASPSWLLVITTDGSGWSGYAEAAAEAAMVGGVADWFAVTALFRHPLRLPIPHTAIIPNRKDQIGESLGDFVQDNFLQPEVLRERLAASDLASRHRQLARGPGERAQRSAIRSRQCWGARSRSCATTRSRPRSRGT